MIFNIQIFIFLQLVVISATYSSERVVLRMKRQQCVCLNVGLSQSPLNNQPHKFECSCSNDDTLTRTSRQQLQYDLQQNLQQVQTTSPSSQCGCTFVIPPVAYGASLQSVQPYYQCNCDGVPNLGKTASSLMHRLVQRVQPLVSHFWPSPSYLRPPQTPSPTMILPAPSGLVQQRQVSQQNIVYPVQASPTQAPPQTQQIPIGNNMCQCVEITVTIPSQFHCTCAVPEQQPNSTYPPSAFNEPGTLPPPQNIAQEPQRDAVISTAPTTTSTTSTSTTTTTSTSTTTANPLSYPVIAEPTVTPASQPQVVPCIKIIISNGRRACACEENYKQCSENICCLKKFSTYAKTEKLTSKQSPASATVDLLMDILQRVKPIFDESKN